MKYLGKVDNFVSERKNAKIVHSTGLMYIVLQESSGKFKKEELIWCTNLKKGKYLFSDTYGRVEDRYNEELIRRQGVIDRIFHDDCSGKTLILGMWNDSYTFREFAKIPKIIWQGMLNDFMCAEIIVGSFKRMREIFVPYILKRVVRADFRGLLDAVNMECSNPEKTKLSKIVDALYYSKPYGTIK